MAYGLGRLVSPDERDKKYLIRSTLPQELPDIRSKYWRSSVWIADQGQTPQCTAFAWCNFLTNSPIYHKNTIIDPHFLYAEEQKVDAWAGTVHDGSTVRAGAQVLQKLGYIGEYNWAFTLNDMIHAVLTLSPVVIGVNWYEKMFEWDSKGLIKIGGSIAGGHALICNGVNRSKGLFRLRNSWNRTWGLNGNAYISFDDMSRLFSENAECCLALEMKI